MLRQIDLHKTIKDALSNRIPKSIDDKEQSYTHAAVLIPLFRSNGECRVLFTKRTKRVEHHKGQISFPGGVVDEEDGSFMETALREAYEEIGLLKENVTILGRIDDRLTLVSNFLIHPFVGIIPFPYNFCINSEEVERLIEVPLNIFYAETPADNVTEVEWGGKTYRGPVYPYQGEVIWGATARIMENFMIILGESINFP